MKLMRFNEAGVARIGGFLDSQTTPAPEEWERGLLDDPDLTQAVEPECELDEREFRDRAEAGKYLGEVFDAAQIEGVDSDRGLWAWLAYLYFAQLCPRSADGTCKPGERARWIPSVGDFRKYYRHLLAGPYRIWRAHREYPERARVLLCTPLHSPGDIVEQLASRQELVTNVAVVGAATELYVDARTGNLKKGARGRGPGSVRRLVDVLNQLDLTWDLYQMEPSSILEKLPEEFARFR